jgi:hypothetical protein
MKVVGTLQTGPSGQIWNVKGKLRRNTTYAIVELPPKKETKA